ncbi:MAG: DOMON-like domain-containing protein [Thiobacillus sp.]|nr:DOMON-like domain-containing protein [Thiobacillus sp.]
MPLTATLHVHPATPCPAVTAGTVELAWNPDGSLGLAYRLAVEPASLRLPAAAVPGRVDGLWRHTCFEAFVMADAGPGYREFNFAPSGQWAAYAFTAYRYGGRDLAMPAPAIACRRDAGGLELVAVLPAAALPAGRLRLGLSAVVEDAAGTIGYWALRHPPGKPDFHHTDAFALVLPRP